MGGTRFNSIRYSSERKLSTKEGHERLSTYTGGRRHSTISSLRLSQLHGQDPELQNRPAADHTHDEQHLANSQYVRDMILGVNDGLVSTFLLVVGVAGGGLPNKDILLTGIAGAIAGAVSMSAGEFVATKAQNAVMEGELELEKEHINDHFDAELYQLQDLLALIGINDEQPELLEKVMSFYRNNPEAVLEAMKTLEFGVVEEEERSPVVAAFFSCLLFSLGAFPSILPYIIFMDDDSKSDLALLLAGVLATVALLIVGAVKSWASRGNFVRASFENLVISGAGGGIAYGVGYLIEQTLH